MSSEYHKQQEEKLKKAFRKEERTFWTGFFIKKFRLTYLIMGVILILGIYSMITLPREAEPEVRVPFASVTTIYPGATPTDMEELVTEKLEEEIGNLENLDTYTSSSGQGVSSIFVQFNAEADLKESFRKLRSATEDAEPSLPSGAESPMVTEIRFSDFPIVTYSLTGDFSQAELKKFADRMQNEFESINGVSKAPIRGGAEREFQIIADQSKLANFNISLSQIVSAVQSANFSLPAGDIEIDGFEYTVRLDGKILNAEDLSDIVVATYDNSPVFLRDVALIKDTFKEKSTESFIGFPGESSKNAISIQVYKKTGGNILDIVKQAEDKVAELSSGDVFPEDLSIIKTNDNSEFIEEDLRTLGTSAVQTVVLITLILLFILSFSGAVITALSVPIAFLMSFIFLDFQGMTLNSMVLFSLVLSLGLMVDNAIVIIEGINEYVSKYKKNIYEASILSIWNFKWPIIAGTLTTVSAFLPMLLVSGILGEYISILPKTISVTLLSSLFAAIIIIPTLASRFIKIKENGRSSHRNKKRHIFVENLMEKIGARYEKLLNKILPEKKKRRKVLLASWILFLVAIATPFLGIMKIEMFPSVDFDYFNVNIELPIGSSSEKTEQVAKELEDKVSKIEGLKNYVVNLGVSASMDPTSGGSSGPHLASFTVNLVDAENREKESYQIAEELREQVKQINDAKVTVSEMQAGPPTGSPIEVRIFGDNTAESAQVAGEIKSILSETNGAINIRDNLENSSGEFTFRVDKQMANYYGLGVNQIAGTLRNAVYGTEASSVNLENEDVEIRVKYAQEFFNDTEDLQNILIQTRSGETVPLKQVAELSLEPALLSINHEDGKNIVRVLADTEPEVSAAEVMAGLNEKIAGLDLPDGITIETGGETEDIQKSFTEMFLSMFVAILLIALILVLQFDSFVQPFIILFSLPLALIGVIAGLNITQQPFSITAFIGVVSLAGIVVNDAIVLIDRINKNIADGMEFFEAIVEGGKARMQPVFLTSITTIAGIFPLLFANEMWIGLSLTIIFGLSLSTILTLVIIPVYYAGLCRKDKCNN